jgi:predicted Zn finger-like uncharacterized protein
MRFVCDSCRAQYMISDDKVGAKGVKVRCKKCGYVILVRRAAAAVPAPAPASPPPPPPEALGEGDGGATQVMENPLGHLPTVQGRTFDPDLTTPGTAMPGGARANGAGGAHPTVPVLSAVPDDEISSVFDQVLNSGHHRVPENHGEALADSPDDRMSTRVLDADMVKKLAEESSGGANGTSKRADGAASYDWFVAVDEKQVGPLNVDKIKAMWDRGEIGPDSLCWRAGFSDWTALSEVDELAAMLAPKPAKPVIVAPVPSGVPAVMTVPVESAFSAGGVMRTVRSEMPMVAAAAGAQEEGGWKPSAASALQSLVKEEIAALTKPAPNKVISSEHSVPEQRMPLGGGLLDVPDPTPVRGNGKHVEARPAGAEAMSPMAAPYAPMAYPQQAYVPYRSDDSSKKMIIIGAIVGGVFLLVLVGLVGYLFASRNNTSAIQQQPQRVLAAAPTPAPVAPTAVAPPPTAPAVAPPATGTPPPPASAKSTEPVKIFPSPSSSGQSTRAEGTRRERTDGSRTERTSGGSEKHVASREKSDGTEGPPSRTRESNAAPKSGDDDAFEREFGGTGKKTTKAIEEPPPESPKNRQKDVYIPAAPGSGGDVPDQLSMGDVMQYVRDQKPAIVDCVKKQRAKEPDSSGTLVMRWTVLTSGKTSGISVQTEEFKSTYLASCMTGLIKGWTFPRHKSSQDPINFPFKF